MLWVYERVWYESNEMKLGQYDNIAKGEVARTGLLKGLVRPPLEGCDIVRLCTCEVAAGEAWPRITVG